MPMADFYTSTEFAGLKEKWYNELERAKDDLADLDIGKAESLELFAYQVTKLQAEIKVKRSMLDDIEVYFKPDAIPKSRPK